MIASVAAWALAIVFFTAGIEKLIGRQARQEFVEVVASLGLPVPLLAAYVYLLGEVSVIPLLLLEPTAGLVVLLFLTAVISIFALVAWIRGDMDSCACGGIWGATGRNLFLRNITFFAAAIYAWRAAPIPLASSSFAYAIAVIVVFLVAAGIAEAVRIRMRTG